MRASILLGVLLLAPMASALLVPVTPLPSDITDAEVLMLLGPTLGVEPQRVRLRVDASVELPALVDRLATRAGASMSGEDLARFAALDSRVAAPTLTLLLAVEQAWDMRDRVFTPTRAADAPLADEELEMLLNAAIMLSDTIESVVIPQLEAAAASDAWPASAVADPVGILRIGGTGNDKETIDRLVQLDARGDDAYYNNAGASQVGSDFTPATSDHPVSVHIDLSGNDEYRENRSIAVGAGYDGIGVAYDLRGADRYRCLDFCLGAGIQGVGIFRDFEGADEYTVADSLGYVSDGVGYAREDEGNDLYHGGSRAGGFALDEGIGLLWDREGIDHYESMIGMVDLWGFTFDNRGAAWFVEETSSVDTWVDRTGRNIPPIHTCNDCTWSAGYHAQNGRGNDNRGGLASLIARQDP